MELRRFVAVVWQRLWLIVLATAMVAGMTWWLSITTTPIYSATTTLSIDLGGDPRSDPYSSLRTGEMVAKTYVEQMKSPVVLREAIRRLGLDLTPAALSKTLTVEQVRDTQLMRVTVESDNPGLAQRLADVVATVFIEQDEARQRARFEAGQRDLDAQIAELEQSIEDTQKAIASLGDPTDPQNVNMPEFARLEMTRLQTQLSRDQTRYVILLKSAEDFRLASARYADKIAIFSPAELPRLPVKPRVTLNTILGVISGLVLGVSTAFLLEYLDDTLKTAEEVEAELGLSTLGHILRMRRVRRLRDGLITSRRGLSRVGEAEGYRVLRTNLQYVGVGDPAATVLVTSAGPREGKTTTLANLGIVTAQAGKRVVLVDTDLRRPTLHRLFELEDGPGLTELLLAEEPDVGAALRPTGVDNLWVLTSGETPPNPAELLGSPRMAGLIDDLKGRAEVVLFDSPPVLAVTDASVLAGRADGVLLVVEAGETRRETAGQAREMLDKVEARLLGAVLNKQQVGRGGGYYYYRYYYSRDGGRKRQKR